MTPLTTRILALIALFEGSANGNINVWDEQLLSLGSMHFAVKAGPGVTFLRRVQQLDPTAYRSLLGVQMDAATRAGPAALLAFCQVCVYQQRDRWLPGFRRLSQTAAWATADAEACAPFLQGGVRLARRYGLSSERGLAWAVDRCVQQGVSVRSVVDVAFGQTPEGAPEYVVMKALARAYAGSANPKYAGIVLARSLTVALGSSDDSGYPGRVNLKRDFDIDAARRWEQP